MNRSGTSGTSAHMTEVQVKTSQGFSQGHDAYLVQKEGVAAGPRTLTRGLAMPVAERARLAT